MQAPFPVAALDRVDDRQLGYSAATRRGTRDFSSVNQVVATTYEVLVEHQHAARAHELLATMPREEMT